MPIYEYKGQQYDIADTDPVVAKNKILAYLDKQAAPVPAPAPTAAPILSPEEITTQAEPTVQPSTGLTEQQKKKLREETARYEEEVPFLQRVTDPLKAGFAAAKGILPGVQVSNIQNEINLIREGKATDPLGRPLTPEAAAARIKELQGAQAQSQQKLMETQAEGAQIRKRPTVEALGDVKTARQAFEAFQIDPLGVMASVSLESAPQMVPALVLGAVTRNPRVGAMAMGSTSFASELSSGVMEYFQDQGVNIKDPVAVNKALNDPTLFSKAYEHAMTRASIIGVVDTAAAGLAGKLLVPKQVIKNQVAKEAVNIGVAQPAAQIISGAGGEAAAQLVTEGEIKKPGQVLMEAVGEGPTSVLETAAFGGREAYERLPSTIAKRETEAKKIEDQKKTLEALSKPGALDDLGKQFNDVVQKLKDQGVPEEEAYARAGDAILQGGLTYGADQSTVGGTDQPSVSVPGAPSETVAGTTEVVGGDLAAAGAPAAIVGGGERTELDTLAANLKAKYNLTDEQAIAAATESLRQKQVAASMGAPTTTSVEPTAEEDLQTLKKLEKRRNAADLKVRRAQTSEETKKAKELLQKIDGEWDAFTKESQSRRDKRIAELTGQPTTSTITEEEAPSAPPVKTGKPRGRPVVARTAEEQAKVDADKKKRQDIGRTAVNDVARAEKTLAKEIDEADIIERSANEKEAQDALFNLREQRIGAFETAYRLTVDPDQKKKTAGTRAAKLLEKATPQELQLAKQRHEDRQKIGAPSRAQRTESTNGQDNTAFEKFDFAKGAVNFIARNGNAFEQLLAKRLLPFLNGVKFVVITDIDEMPTPFLRDKMADAAGLYVPDRKTIYVMRNGGINNTVVLHEALHAATVARIDAYLESTQLRKQYKPVPPSLSVPVLELMYTMDAAKQNYDRLKAEALESGNLGILTEDMLAIPDEAFTDIKEFLAYGMSLPAMQDFLLITPGNPEITYAGEPVDFISSLFNRFVQGIRQLFNMDEKHTSALQDLIIVTDKLLSAPLPETAAEPSEALAAKAKQPAPPKAPKPPKQLKMVENLLRKIRLSQRSSELNGSIGELIMQVRNVDDALRLLRAVYGSINVGTLNKILPTLTTDDITRWAGDRINNLKVINSAVDDMAGMRVRMLRELAEKTPAWVTFNAQHEEGGIIIGDLMNASTLLEVDPTKYPDMATALKNDAKLQKIESEILNPTTDPKTLPNLKKQRTQRTAAIKLVYQGGTFNNPVTGEKYTMGGWEQLGKIGKGEGHAIYKMAKDSYQDTFDLHEQLLKDKIAASNVPGTINDASTPKGKLIAAITKTFQEAKTLEVYFPLMRYGNFWYSVGKGKSGEFYMFESTVARNNAIEARVAELNKAGDKRTKDQMIADGDIDVGDDIRKLREKVVESSSMLKEIFEMLDKNKTADIDVIKDNVYQMYLMTLPEKDIRRKFTHRQGKTGFSADVLRNFIVSQHTAANQLARLKYADKIRNGIAAAYAEIQQNPDKLKLAAFIREVSTRALSEITPQVPTEDIDWNKLAAIGNKFVFYWLLTSPKSALVQMTQLPIVGLPTLGAEFGVGRAFATAARYSALWNKFGTSKTDANGNVITEWGQPSINDSSYVNKHPDPAYRKILKDAWNFANDKDIFMSTYAGDMYAMSEAPTTQYRGVISRGTRAVFNAMGGAFHHAERISREIMFMSAFELAYAKSKNFDEATKKALQLTYDSLFNYTQYNKPRLMKANAATKLGTQFLTYPLQMTSYLVRNFYGMLPFLNKEEKRDAAIKFFGTLGMTGLFAGITGFPLYSFIIGMAEGMRELMRDEEDEDYDEDDAGNPLGKRSLDLWFRNWFIPNYFGPDSDLAQFFGLTEEQAATLARGVEMGPISAITDLNVGTSTSLDGLWFRSDTPAETSREAFINFVFSFTGPIGSIGANMMGAFDDFNNGRINRGFEKLSPAWLKGGLTAYRLGTEGATTTTGDELMNPEFYTTGKLLAQTLGFGSTEVGQVQKANFTAKQIVSKINREKQQLLNRLDVAVRQNDDGKIDSILEEIDEFNSKNAMLAINGETVSKSLQARAERRGEAYQGLSVSDKEAPFVYPLVEGTRSPQYK
jgi:hypothetical protein